MATLHIAIEDVSEADAPAVTVAGEQVTLPAGHYEAGRIADLRLEVPAVNERVHYAVSAHLDKNGAGELKAGDWINMQSYPVLTFGFPAETDVLLQAI